MNLNEYFATLRPKLGMAFSSSEPQNLWELLQKIGTEFNTPNILGSGVQSTVLDLDPKNILKRGPKFSKWHPDFEEPLEGRLSPNWQTKWNGDYIQAFPRAEVLQKPFYFEIEDFKKLPLSEKEKWYIEQAQAEENPVLRRLMKIGLAYDTHQAADDGLKSLFANSYEPVDLHAENVGNVPGQGIVSIDTEAGLVPITPDVQEGQYPRQGYIIGDNLINRWANEVLRPQATGVKEAGPVARKLLASYPREVY